MLFWRRDAASGDARITFLAIAVICAVIGVAVLPALAAADTASVIAPSDPHDPQTNSGWQAGTCKQEPVIVDPNPADFCNVASTPPSAWFFEEASGHPNWGFTQFIVAHEENGINEAPTNELAWVRVDLPVGLAVNPGATERCPIATFEASAASCPPGSKVGESGVTAYAPIVGSIPPIPGVTAVSVYNVVPKEGEAARFGLELAGNEVFLEGDIDWSGDYHEGFTIAVPHALPIELPLIRGAILKNRLRFEGRSGDGTFLTTPSTCNGEAFTQSGSQYSTFLKAASYEEIEAGESFPEGAGAPLESPIPPGTSPKSCNTIPYDPAIAVAPGTAETNSPAPAQVTVSVPHIKQAEGQDDSTTKETSLTLPAGMGINPSAAAAPNNLQTCENAQFPMHSRQAISCPSQSKIGKATIESAAIPEGNLEGNVYIGKQESTEPASGNEYRIFIDAASSRYGIDVRLLAHVHADPVTGQLTTTITEVPQVPFTNFRLEFEGGQRATLSSPPTCGPNTSAASMVPYSGNAAAKPTASFSLKSAPGGGGCATSLGARPFSPSFASGPRSNIAGAYSPLGVTIARPNGQQELKGASIALAPGMIGKLAGIPYCPESALSAAAASSGAEQAPGSSCPAASQVGIATVQAGTAAVPLSISGKVFLTGPYKGAPFSLAVITPAVAGPFDLGTVVTRVQLQVNPETAQVTAVSDPIPDVFGGSQLSIRQISLEMTKQEFTLNPTSCAKLTTTATLNGGGSNPASQPSWSTYTTSVPFQTSSCRQLKFRPKLTTRLIGGTRRAAHPKIRATLVARQGDANIARATLTLPRSELLDQSHIHTICTRVQLAAHKCPKKSVYGRAEAKSPLLSEKLKGPVYLVSSDHVLPDLLADLRGQVEIQLHGVIKSVNGGRIRTTFSPVPDVPVSKFVLQMQGGKKGLLQNSRNLCTHKYFSKLNFLAQNGKHLRKKRLPLGTACKKIKRPKKSQGKKSGRNNG